MGRPSGSIALEEQREIAKRAFLLLPPGEGFPWGVPTDPLVGMFFLAEQSSYPHHLYQKDYPDYTP